MTNFEKIKSMSIEEMAECLVYNEFDYCPIQELQRLEAEISSKHSCYQPEERVSCKAKRCYMGAEEWLNKEVE